MTQPTDGLDRLLQAAPAPTIAVSGGVDSMTLASLAHRLRTDATMVHAVSPAVPAAATARVRALARAEGWDLRIVDAGEFADPRYRSNPLNRCYFCKSNLYATLSALAGRGGPAAGVVLSGANLDDLGDYRPGLEAAAEHAVRHPYVEAGMSKAEVRALARRLGLDALAELPSSPCLSSRIETGLEITRESLALVEQVEEWLTGVWGAEIARCRVRPDGVEIELGPEAFDALHDRPAFEAALRRACPALGQRRIRVGAYRRGSAFVGDKTGAAVS